MNYNFTGNFTSLRAGLVAAGRSVDDFGGKLTALDKNGAKMRQGLTTIGTAAGAIALGAAAGLTAIVAVTANFEKSMSRVQAATGESTAGMEKLRDAALKAGADTAFSASEAADGITALAKAGISTTDILEGGLTGALDLAAAGELGVAQAAEIAATTMTQFKLSGEDTAHIADVLAASAGKAQGEVTDMAGALKYVGPVASQMNISLEETAGTIAYLATQGVLGTEAGTSLRGMLTSLTSPSKIAKDEMDKYGISLYDAQGNMIGFNGIAQQLQDSMGNLSNAERDEALGRIFGNEQITAARILYAGGASAVNEWTNNVNDSGFAAEQAATKLDNLSGDLEALKGSLETALIGAGSGSQGPVRKMVQSLTNVVNAFNDLPGPAQSAVTALLGVTAVLGGGLWATSKVVNGISAANTALQALGGRAITTRGFLTAIGRTALPLAAVAASVTLINKAINESNSIDASTIVRDLEALSDGRATGNLDQLAEDFKRLAEEADKGARLFGASTDEVKAETGTFYGLFGDTAADTALKNIQSFDEALAQMVEAGDISGAADAFNELRDAAAEAGLEGKAFNDIFAQYSTALTNAGLDAPGAFLRHWAAAAGFAATATTDAGNAAAVTGTKVSNATSKWEPMTKAMKDARKAAQGTAEEFFNLGDSLNNKKVSLSGWIADMRKAAKALENFQKNAETAAHKGLDEGLIASLQEAGPEGALRMRQLANATKTEIAKANNAWQLGRENVRSYTDAIGGVPKKVKTDIILQGIDPAIAKIHGLISVMSSVHDKVVHITTVFTEHHNIDINRTTSHAAGGYTGHGAKYESAGEVHKGEVVLPQEVVKRDASLLYSRYGYLPGMSALAGYARGGLVTIGGVTTRSYAAGGYAGTHLDTSLGGIGGALHHMSAELERAVERLKRANQKLREMEKALEKQNKAIEKQQRIVDDAFAEVERIRGEMASFREDIAGRLTKGIFEGSEGFDFGQILSNLAGNQAAGQSWAQSLATLQHAGLSTEALQALQQQATAEQLAGFANLTPEQIAQFVKAFNSSTAATQAAGGFGAQLVYGEALAEANLTASRQEAILQRQEDIAKEMRIDIRKQTKYVEYLERHKDKVEEREQKNAKNLDKIADKNLGKELNDKAGAGSRANG